MKMSDQEMIEYDKWLNDCYSEEDRPDPFEDAMRLAKFCDTEILQHLENVRKLCEFLKVTKFPSDAIPKNIEDLIDRLEALTDSVLAWNETDDPRENGWVDDRGRP